MKATDSLQKNYQFRRVYHRGKSMANRHLVLYVLKNNKKKNYLGISVSKKVGKSVIRSRVTRLIRESYRLMEEEILVGYDLVFIARNATNIATYHEISASLRHVLKKQGLLQQKAPDSTPNKRTNSQ